MHCDLSLLNSGRYDHSSINTVLFWHYGTVLQLDLLSLNVTGEENQERLEVCFRANQNRLQPGLTETVRLSISSLEKGKFLLIYMCMCTCLNCISAY